MVLPITDAAWLMIERSEAPQHVGGLMVFDLPDDASSTWVATLHERLRGATAFVPPFSQRLRHPYGRAFLHAWEPDDSIDLDHHLRRSALPRPGGLPELFAAVSHLHSTVLDRHRPLWEIHLIEGLEGRRFAMYAKFHHSILDGVGALRVVQRMLSVDPARRDMAAPWETPTDRRAAEVAADPGVSTTPARTGLAIAATPPRRFDALRAVGPVARALGGQLLETRGGRTGDVMPFSAPRSPLNGRITGSRRFVAEMVPLDRMRQVAAVHDVTVNDIALAMSSHAIRTHLRDEGGTPGRTMTAMVPVSIRTEDEGARGVALSFVVTDLGTDLADPVDRLARISRSMMRGKDRLAGLSRTERIGYALAITSPYVVGSLLGVAGRGRPVANIVISNLEGPREPRWFDGARLHSVYPLSLLQQGQALNITLTSYDGAVQFGLTACRRSLPEVHRLLPHLHAALDVLDRTAG